MATASTNYFPETGYSYIDGLLSGAYWDLNSDRTLTWSIADNDIYSWLVNEVPAIQSAFDAWEAVINIDFIYTGHYSDYRQNSADIVITATDSSVLGTAHAIGVFPNSQYADETILPYVGETPLTYPQPEGDIGLNIDIPFFDFDNLGSQAFHTVLHEIGHAIGLKHPHDGGVAGYTTYEQAGISILDDGLFTLMSYDETSHIWPFGWSSTPLPLDILAAQTMYGANPTTNSGDTPYILNDDGQLQTIYDVSGTDTLIASNIQHGVTLDLINGNVSTTGSLSKAIIAIDTIIENAVGTQWSDSLTGNEVSNRLYGLGGNDFIIGGDGVDTAIYSNYLQNYTILINDQYSFVSDNTLIDGVDTLQGVERLSFIDSAIALDIDGIPGQAYRIYKAAFDRTPDHGGLGFWIDALDNGALMSDVAYGFTHSTEFISLYGENSSDEEFINLMYNNVLDRDADQGGYDFWTGHLDSGAITREGILIEFSESAENQANVIDLIANGIQYTEWG